MSDTLKRLRRRSRPDWIGRLSRTADKSRGAWRLPDQARRLLREASTSAVIGNPKSGAKSILIVSHEMGASGAPKLMAEVARACLAAGWAVTVIAPERGIYECLAEEGAAVVIHPDALGVFSPAITIAAEVDLIVCNTIACDTLADFLPAEKVIWFLHETGAIDHVREVRPASMRRIGEVRDVWASSQLVARHVALERPMCFVIGAAVEPARAASPAGVHEPATMVVLGGLESRKGQDLAVAAYHRLPDEVRAQIEMHFYGRNLDPAYGDAVIASISASPGLHYVGAVPPNAAVEAIASADLVLIPSRDEPLSLVAIEGMSAHRVVICSQAAGIASYISDGISGFVAEEASPAALAEAVERAVIARGAWPDIGARAELVYDLYFSPEAFHSVVRDRLSALMGSGTKSDDNEPDDWSDPDLYHAYTGL